MDTGEQKRLRALHNYNIMDTEAEKAFDNLTKLAAQICGTSVSQINFLDETRQWAKSTVGWGKAEMPVEMGFCIHTIKSKDQFLIVNDTFKDERFVDNPLVKNDPPLRFYTGITLNSHDNYPLGALCVYDSEPKNLNEQQLESLTILAEEVETHLKLRLSQDQLKEQLILENVFNDKILESLPIGFYMFNESGNLVRWNKKLEQITGYSRAELLEMQPEDYFDERDRDLVSKKIERVFNGKQTTLEANIVNKDGEKVPLIFSASIFKIDDKNFAIGTGQDVSELKEIQDKLSLSLHEKVVLLAELHHRVKNNLAVISGIIQLETLEDDIIDSQKRLVNTILRIKTMSQVHEVMYKMENLAYVAFHEVVMGVISNIEGTFKRTSQITLCSDIEEIYLNVNQAIPCGLIVNELLSNAWKHAYIEGQKGLITLKVREENGNIILKVSDKGQGLPSHSNPDSLQNIGITLVKNFASQLNAKINMNTETGTEYVIQFEKKEVKGSSSNFSIQYHQ